MRPLIIITVGYITGILWGLYLEINIVPIIFIFFFGGIFLIKKKYKLYLILFTIFILISNLQIKSSENKFNSLYSNLEKIEVTGIIVSSSKETNYKKSYEIKVLCINGDTKYKNTKLLVYIDKSLNLEYGKKVKLTGDYKKAADSTNYKTFSYKNYLKTKNIYGTLTADKNIEVSKENYLNPLFIT